MWPKLNLSIKQLQVICCSSVAKWLINKLLCHKLKSMLDHVHDVSTNTLLVNPDHPLQRWICWNQMQCCQINVQGNSIGLFPYFQIGCKKSRLFFYKLPNLIKISINKCVGLRIEPRLPLKNTSKNWLVTHVESNGSADVNNPQNLGRTRTPYTATYNGAVSYGAKIGSTRVFTEQRASTNRVGLRNFKGALVALRPHCALQTWNEAREWSARVRNQLLPDALREKHESTQFSAHG